MLTAQTDRHKAALALVAQIMRQHRHLTAVEVGLVGGRADIAVVRDGEVCWLLEVKVRNEAPGVGQLLRYRKLLGTPALLTLVVDAGRATDALRKRAAAAQVGIWEMDLSAPLVGDPAMEYAVDLPRIHPDEQRRADARRREWLARHDFVFAPGDPLGTWRPRSA